MEKVNRPMAYGATAEEADESSGVPSAEAIAGLKHNYPPAVAAAASVVFHAAASPRHRRHIEMGSPHALMPTRTTYLSALELLHNERFELDLSDGSDSDGDEGGNSLTSETKTGALSEAELLNAKEYNRKSYVESDFAQMEEVAHYAHYALAAYSTLMYLYVNPCSGMCRLCCCSPSTQCNSPLGVCLNRNKKKNVAQNPSCCCRSRYVKDNPLCHRTCV